MSEPLFLFTEQCTDSGYFGLCRACGKTDGCINVGREHFFVCETHRTYWHIGSNLFSGWREEDANVWQQNVVTLSTYAEIRPIFPIDLELSKSDLEPEECPF
jgi:hypothetical protein